MSNDYNPYGPNTKLAVMGAPLDSFTDDESEIIDASDYNPFTDRREKPKVLITREPMEIVISKRTAEDEVIVEAIIDGVLMSIPRWMLKHFSSPD